MNGRPLTAQEVVALQDDIVNTIVNDGDGSQCGYSYARRCRAAKIATLMPWAHMVTITASWLHGQGNTDVSRLTVSDELAIAAELARYYELHAKDV